MDVLEGCARKSYITSMRGHVYQRVHPEENILYLRVLKIEGIGLKVGILFPVGIINGPKHCSCFALVALVGQIELLKISFALFIIFEVKVGHSIIRQRRILKLTALPPLAEAWSSKWQDGINGVDNDLLHGQFYKDF